MAISNFIKNIYPISGTVSDKNLRVEFYDNPGRKARKASIKLNVRNGETNTITVRQSGNKETMSLYGISSTTITGNATHTDFKIKTNTKQIFVPKNNGFTTLSCDGNKFNVSSDGWYYTIPGDPGGISGDQIYTITIGGIKPNISEASISNTITVVSYKDRLSASFTYCQDSIPISGVTGDTLSLSPLWLSFTSGETLIGKTVVIRAREAWTATTINDWITITPNTGSTGLTMISISVNSDTSVNRDGRINFKTVGVGTGIVTVSQMKFDETAEKPLPNPNPDGDYIINYTTRSGKKITLDASAFTTDILSHEYGKIVLAHTSNGYKINWAAFSPSWREGEEGIDGQTQIYTMEIGEGCSELGDQVFYHCGVIQELILPHSLRKVGRMCFETMNLDNIVIPEGVITIENEAFRYNSTMNITLPSTLKSIPWGAFAGIGTLNISGGNVVDGHYLVIDSSLIVVGNKNLTKINIPKSVTKIHCLFPTDNGLFDENLIIPEQITEIGGSAFNGCMGIKSITLNEGIERIEENAFSTGDHLDYIRFTNPIPSVKCAYIDFVPIDNVDVIYVPNGSEEMYKLFIPKYADIIQPYGDALPWQPGDPLTDLYTWLGSGKTTVTPYLLVKYPTDSQMCFAKNSTVRFNKIYAPNPHIVLRYYTDKWNTFDLSIEKSLNKVYNFISYTDSVYEWIGSSYDNYVHLIDENIYMGNDATLRPHIYLTSGLPNNVDVREPFGKDSGYYLDITNGVRIIDKDTYLKSSSHLSDTYPYYYIEGNIFYEIPFEFPSEGDSINIKDKLWLRRSNGADEIVWRNVRDNITINADESIAEFITTGITVLPTLESYLTITMAENTSNKPRFGDVRLTIRGNTNYIPVAHIYQYGKS